jgi:hypothetical protein
MKRKLIFVFATAAVVGTAAAGTADASRYHRKWRSEPVVYPAGAWSWGGGGFYRAPFYSDGSIYCWHWFRTGRTWARAWAC